MIKTPTTKSTEGKTSFPFASLMGCGRKVTHMEGVSKTDEERIIKLVDSLSGLKDNRTVDIPTVVNQAFPLFEATIGAADFQKIKKHFGIGYKASQKNVGKPGEIQALLSKLKTIENAMYYISGFREIIEGCASKLLFAPEDMDMLTRAKIVILYYRVFFNQEQFVEDYTESLNFKERRKEIKYNETVALKNNMFVIGPEEILVLYYNKVKHIEGIYYDAIAFELNRVGKLQGELFEFGEIEFDKEKGRFVSVNRCMVSPTFGRIRLLKKKCSTPRPKVMMEMFAAKHLIDRNIDAVVLYNIFKMFSVTPWQQLSEKTEEKFRTLSGSIFVDTVQEYYRPFQNLEVADESEAERWMHLMRYLCRINYVAQNEVDAFGNMLPAPKTYNMGAFWGALSFGNDMGWIGNWTTVDQDMDVVDKLLAMPEAEEIFISYKDEEITSDHVMMFLKISEEYAKTELQKLPDVEVIKQQIAQVEAEILAKKAEEPQEEPAPQPESVPEEEPQVETEVTEVPEVPMTVFEYTADNGEKFIVKVPHVVCENPEEFNLPHVSDEELPDIGGKNGRVAYMMIESLIRHALSEGYIEYPDEIAMDVLVEIFVPNHQATVMEYRRGSIGGFGLEFECGIPEGYGEGFFNIKKLDMKMLEDKLMELKTNRHSRSSKDVYFDHRGIVRLYCYIVNNNVACGPKKKVPKRNSALKPKILESLIA